MANENAGLSAAFVAQQRKQLEALRAQLLGMEQNREAEVRPLTERLATVERALEKIREGTYGLSDASCEPIPRVRLEAVPEAIYTVEEEERRERERRAVKIGARNLHS